MSHLKEHHRVSTRYPYLAVALVTAMVQEPNRGMHACVFVRIVCTSNNN